MKPSSEDRILQLEQEVEFLRKLVVDGRREGFEQFADRIFLARTDAGSGGTYPTSPANVFPAIFQDVVVDTGTTGNQTVTRRDRSASPKRNVFSSEFLADQSEVFVVEHLGRLHALQAGAKVNILEGRASGDITAGSSGLIDNLEVVIGSYGTIADTAQTEIVHNHTTAFTINDNAWVIAIQQDDGDWYVINAECLGDPTYGVITAPEYATVGLGGTVSLAKTPELIISVDSEDGSGLQEDSHFTVNKPLQRLELIERTYQGSGPALYEGGHIEGELMRIVYMSKD